MQTAPRLFINKAPDYLRPFDPYIGQYLQSLTPMLAPSATVMILGGNLATLAVELSRRAEVNIFLVLDDEAFCDLTVRHLERNDLAQRILTLHPGKNRDQLEALRGMVDLLVVEPPMASVFLVPGWWRRLLDCAELLHESGRVFPGLFSFSACLASKAALPPLPASLEALAQSYRERFDVDLAPVIADYRGRLYPQFVKVLPQEEIVISTVRSASFTLEDVKRERSLELDLEVSADGEVASLYLQFLFRESERNAISSALSGPFQQVELLLPENVQVRKGDKARASLVPGADDFLDVQFSLGGRSYPCRVHAAGLQPRFTVLDHISMLCDTERTAAYDRALRQKVTPESRVLDLGCGTGILSLLALKAGAASVTGIERDAGMLEIAKTLMEVNGCSDRFTAVSGDSREAVLAVKADLLVTETLGDKIFNEGILESVVDARRRHLAEGGAIIPGRLEVFLFASETGTYAGPTMETFSRNLEKDTKLDLSLYREELGNVLSVEMQRYNPQQDFVLTGITSLGSFDLGLLVEEGAFFDRTATLECESAGQFNSLWAFFMAYLTEDQAVTNFPPGGMTHWRLVRFFDFPARDVKERDAISVRLWYDGEFKMAPLGVTPAAVA